VARRIEERVGPDLELDGDDIVTYAKDAARAVVRVALEELLEPKTNRETRRPDARRIWSTTRVGWIPPAMAGRAHRRRAVTRSRLRKIFHRRASGAEQSWRKRGAEAMLHLRAANPSEDGRLERGQAKNGKADHDRRPVAVVDIVTQRGRSPTPA